MDGLLFVIIALTAAIPACVANKHSNVSGRDFCSALVLLHGYACQEHNVITEDGYILKLHRVGPKSSGSGFRPPVYLQHGLFQGGDDWVFYPPKSSLGFILADNGFDVWIGNLRGTHWSREHVSHSSQERSYWQWSWDQHAAYDLPALLNFVHRTTASKLYYVGHSQGTLIALAAFSESKTTDIVKAAVLLSPIAYLQRISSLVTKLGALLYFDQIYSNLGESQFTLESGPGALLIAQVCLIDPQCADLLTLVTGANCCFNKSLTSYYRQFEPQGTSTRNLVHLAQMVRSGLFSKFDYGTSNMNSKAYSQVIPPAYEPSMIPKTLPLLLAYGGKDALSTPADVHQLVGQLQGCTYELLYLPHYAHADFIIGTDAKYDVFGPVINFLRAN